MLNKILVDNNLVFQLLINIQPPRTFDNSWLNSIIITIDADSTPNQSLQVNGGSQGSTSYPITSGQIQDIEIGSAYWNMGGSTTITLDKNGSSVGVLNIQFPEQIDSLGMLNRDENFSTQFQMSGSMSDPSDLAQEVGSISQEVETITQDLGNKQNFIELDILPPSGSGRVGDIVLNEKSNGSLVFWRYNSDNQWHKMPFVQYSDTDAGVGSALGTGEVLLIYE